MSQKPPRSTPPARNYDKFERMLRYGNKFIKIAVVVYTSFEQTTLVYQKTIYQPPGWRKGVD